MKTFYSFNLFTRDEINIKKFKKFINQHKNYFYPFENDVKTFIEQNFENDFIEFFSDDIYSWEEREEELLNLSLEFKETIFVLECKGEQIDDYFREYYHKGKKLYIEPKIYFPYITEKDFDFL